MGWRWSYGLGALEFSVVVSERSKIKRGQDMRE